MESPGVPSSTSTDKKTSQKSHQKTSHGNWRLQSVPVSTSRARARGSMIPYALTTARNPAPRQFQAERSRARSGFLERLAFFAEGATCCVRATTCLRAAECEAGPHMQAPLARPRTRGRRLHSPTSLPRSRQCPPCVTSTSTSLASSIIFPSGSGGPVVDVTLVSAVPPKELRSARTLRSCTWCRSVVLALEMPLEPRSSVFHPPPRPTQGTSRAADFQLCCRGGLRHPLNVNPFFCRRSAFLR